MNNLALVTAYNPETDRSTPVGVCRKGVALAVCERRCREWVRDYGNPATDTVKVHSAQWVCEVKRGDETVYSVDFRSINFLTLK